MTSAHGRTPEDTLAACLADALRLRCSALEEMLRQHAGPSLMLAMVMDIRRLSHELTTALEAHAALERIRHPQA
ncbi:MAG: hypothetical protein HY856_19030 [Burkholderiales bacterium]|nr:hypothetical protein [Burkholderiales bacterium]